MNSKPELHDAHLDGVHDLVAGVDGTHDHNGVAGVEELSFEQRFQREINVAVEVNGIEGDHEGNHAPVEGELLGNILLLAEREDARRGREGTDDSQDYGGQPEAVPRVCAEGGKRLISASFELEEQSWASAKE